MKTVNTLDDQRLVDISIQELGDIERLFELAVLNDVSPTNELPADTALLVPDYDKSKRGIVQIFSDPSLWPASADSLVPIPNLPPGGIGYMKITDPDWQPQYNDFIVS